MDEEVRRRLYRSLLGEIDLKNEMTDEELYAVINSLIERYGKTARISLQEKMQYRAVLFAALRRLDILSIAMDDPEITEIMVNNADEIFIERGGGLEPYEGTFTTPEKLGDVVQQIASGVNRRVNEASPMVDARLPDGSRVNIVLPPVAIDGPAVTIRRFQQEPVSMGQLESWGSITEEAARFLKAAVACRYNIFISGGTGAGKTTFLGALAEFIPQEERVITVEDAAELRLRNVRNLVRLESRPPNLEGAYEVTIRDLIRNALRMRPDRIIVGEIRGGEALEMLQAMNTGHDGSLSTGHANSAKDMLSRIETMCLMGSVDLPLPAIRAQIASGIDLMVHLSRMRDHSRKVTGIYEVRDVRQGEVVLAPLFELSRGDDGAEELRLRRTGEPFLNAGKLEAAGITEEI